MSLVGCRLTQTLTSSQALLLCMTMTKSKMADKEGLSVGERLLKHTKTYFLLFEFHFKVYRELLSWKLYFGRHCLLI